VEKSKVEESNVSTASLRAKQDLQTKERNSAKGYTSLGHRSPNRIIGAINSTTRDSYRSKTVKNTTRAGKDVTEIKNSNFFDLSDF
jgi:hypothetical protein